jgi:hypothetical protein
MSIKKYSTHLFSSKPPYEEPTWHTRLEIAYSATSTQVSGLVLALLARATNLIKIVALTRNITSSEAKAMANDSRIVLLTGDPTNPKAILRIKYF